MIKPMSKRPWRIQGDIAHGENDPILTVFLGDVEHDDHGNPSVRQDVRSTVLMRLSALAGASDLAEKVDEARIANAAATDAQETVSSET